MNIYDLSLTEIHNTGWTKGDFYEDLEKPFTSAACMRGALHRVNGSTMVAVMSTEAISTTGEGLLADIIAEQYPDRLAPTGRNVVAHFNDHKDTTLDEVITIFEKASTMHDEKVTP